MRQSKEFGRTLTYLRSLVQPTPTQAQLATAFGVSQTTLSRYLTGDASPRLSNLPIIAGYFGLSVEQFNAVKVPDLLGEADLNDTDLPPPAEQEEFFMVKLQLTSGSQSLLDAITRLKNAHQTFFQQSAA